MPAAIAGEVRGVCFGIEGGPPSMYQRLDFPDHPCDRPACEHNTPGLVHLDVIDPARRVMALMIGFPIGLGIGQRSGSGDWSWCSLGWPQTAPGGALPLPVGIIRCMIAGKPAFQLGMRIVPPISGDPVGKSSEKCGGTDSLLCSQLLKTPRLVFGRSAGSSQRKRWSMAPCRYWHWSN
jgi:hypothetical protein